MRPEEAKLENLALTGKTSTPPNLFNLQSQAIPEGPEISKGRSDQLHINGFSHVLARTW